MKQTLLTLAAVAWLSSFPAGLRAESRNIHVVIGSEAPKLERFAAEELASQFKTLFGANVVVGNKVPSDATEFILLGSPATNPAVKAWASDTWPKLSDQGHLLRSLRQQDKKGLLVGGGSPVATLWAVYELAHRFGMRYTKRGDMPPAERPTLKLDGFDIVLEPVFRVRAFQMMDASPIGPEAWGLAEQRGLIRQLAKLKFNQVVLPLHPWQPFSPMEVDGAKKQLAVLFSGQRFPLDSGTAGRTAFPAEAKEFANPDFVSDITPRERTVTGYSIIRGIIETAQQHGMSAILTGDGSEWIAAYENKLEARVLRRALFTVFPNADEIVFWSPEGLDRRVCTWRRRGPGQPAETVADRPLSARRLALDRTSWPRALPGRDVVVLPIDGDGLLPRQSTRSAETLLKKLREDKWQGYLVQMAVPADQDLCLHFLSRAGFDGSATAQSAFTDFINAVYGEGVADRLIRGYDKVEEATNLLGANDPVIADLQENVVMKHYRSKGPVPDWLPKARDLYTQAMDEMYRANQRARNVSQEPIFYHAKRFEFALSYLTCLESLHKAAQAREQGDKKQQLEHLEKATETLFNGLAALGEVAHDGSNRGVLAVLNNYGYRPLREELERVEKAGKDKK